MSTTDEPSNDPSAATPTGPPEVVDSAADGRSSVSDPAKLIRLGTMVQTLMAELRETPPDEEGRKLLARIYGETIEELGTVLSPDLMQELSEFTDHGDAESGGVPSEGEIRVAHAQLVGWLQGLLQGLQASMVAQQAVAQRQLQQMQGRGPGPAPGRPGGALPAEHAPGTYL